MTSTDDYESGVLSLKTKGQSEVPAKTVASPAADRHTDPAPELSKKKKPVPEEIRAALAALPVKPRDRYKFLRTIGFGGMKSVLLVYDIDTQREVALAIMPDFRERKVEEVIRFVQEAQLTAQLEHPNIVPVHDLGIDRAGAPYFTMKYLQGRTLSNILHRLREGDPDTLEWYDLPRLLRIYLRICNAVSFAHSQNIIHLDLKPENVNIGEFGEVQILDWGLAKVIGDQEPETGSQDLSPEAARDYSRKSLTLNGVAKGTPGYMAPEQAAGKNNARDQRTDVYALGAILYAILTFSSPLAGKQLAEMLRETIKGNIKKPREMRNPYRPVPAALDAICRKAMALNADARYQSVADLKADISAYLAGYSPKAENASLSRKVALFIGRNGLWLALITTLLVLLSALILFFYAYMNNVVVINE